MPNRQTCSEFTKGRTMGQTDGRTDARPLHEPCSAYYAGSVNNQLVMHCELLILALSSSPCQ